MLMSQVVQMTVAFVLAGLVVHGMAERASRTLIPATRAPPAHLAVSPDGRFVALADGEWRDEALGFDRIFYLFPPSHTDNARTAWRALATREDVECRYWKQDGGKWVQGP